MIFFICGPVYVELLPLNSAVWLDAFTNEVLSWRNIILEGFPSLDFRRDPQEQAQSMGALFSSLSESAQEIQEIPDRDAEIRPLCGELCYAHSTHTQIQILLCEVGHRSRRIFQDYAIVCAQNLEKSYFAKQIFFSHFFITLILKSLLNVNDCLYFNLLHEQQIFRLSMCAHASQNFTMLHLITFFTA